LSKFLNVDTEKDLSTLLKLSLSHSLENNSNWIIYYNKRNYFLSHNKSSENILNKFFLYDYCLLCVDTVFIASFSVLRFDKNNRHGIRIFALFKISNYFLSTNILSLVFLIIFFILTVSSKNFINTAKYFEFTTIFFVIKYINLDFNYRNSIF
jgi:hypothetical protein